MSSFFADALGDSLIGAGQVKLVARTTLYVDGFSTHTETITKFTAQKSFQPLTPDEAFALGFGDYGTNEFITLISLKKIPMPSGTGATTVVRFNNKDWYVRKVLPWVWDEGTPFAQGYYEVIMSRFEETKVNPN